MLQELTELDFDTYFDVASANQPQQTANHRDILYHDHQQNKSNNSVINAASQNPTYTQQQTSFDFIDWDNLNPQQPHLDRSSSMQMSPVSSPQSSSDGYTSHSLSPQMNINSSSFYIPFSQHVKDEANKALEGFFKKNDLFPSVQGMQNVPSINIPTTPIAELNPVINATSDLPSPPLDINPLSGAFSAINEWRLSKDNNPVDKNSEHHETRNWRNSSIRHQQLQQPISNSLDRSISEPGKQLKKVAHNAIERRYRNNINDRIRELKNVVPALYKARIKEKGDDDDSSTESGEDGSGEIVEGVEVAKKLNKATILRKATEYIDHLKRTNETTEQENMILQQIIAQMPGGQDVLSRFLRQKNEYQKSKHERLIRERQEAQEHEKIERQRVLRERAAQRAALAQLLPKPERRPYRRRQSSKNSKKSSQSSNEDNSGSNRMFMAVFLCVTFFATPASSPLDNASSHHYSANQSSTTVSHTLSSAAASSSFVFWHYTRYAFYAFGIVYICLIPIILRWLRPRPVNLSKGCLRHHHYASEVPTAWSRLYTNLITIVNKSTMVKPHATLSSLYDIFCYSLSLLMPRFLLVVFYKNAKPVGCPEELAYIGAWIRLNEVECLGANPDITRLGMLHSCVGMLAQLHKMKRDEKHGIYCEAHTMARIYATTAMQLELCLPATISAYLTPLCWRRVMMAMKQQTAKKTKEPSSETSQPISQNWLTSVCHDQVRYILQTRNGFRTSTADDACRNTFYSFVLPYITSPLDLVLYWQQLDHLQQCWHAYLNGARPSFSEIRQDQLVSGTTAAHMLQWSVRLGLALDSLHPLDALADYTQAASHPSSSILRRHRAMLLHLLEAATALRGRCQVDQVPHLLRLAMKGREASQECICQIAATESGNLEASVLVLSTLAVELRTLKALIVYRQTQRDDSVVSQAVSCYLGPLRDSVLQGMASPYTKTLSAKCKKHVQSYIAQANDTLGL